MKIHKIKKLLKKQKLKIKKRKIHKAVLFFAPSFIFGVFLLNVSFSSQAPEKNWNQPWKDACEETSIVMVDNFYNNRNLDTESAKKEILNIFSLKERIFGSSLDEDAEKIIYLINNFLNWEASIVKNPTLEQMKEQLKNSNPIILPVSAKKLNNPNMNTSGYHVIVISGYDDKKKLFIAQEPGTKFGKNFSYPYSTIISAMNGYKINGKNEKNLAIFTTNKLAVSLLTDGDEDGYTKKDELESKTSLFSSDTDGDGYTDGKKYTKQSVKNTFSDGDLVRLKFDYRIYLIENNKKRHLANATALGEMERNWNEIKFIDAKNFNSLETGSPIDHWPENKENI